MSNIVPVNPQLPAAIRNAIAAAGKEIYSEFAGGVQSGFPILSYKGKVWAVRKGGETHPALNEQGDPVPSLDVVLVKSNSLPSKTFYDKKYQDGDNTPPRCWSSGGVKPDANVTNPISKSCAACPNSVWGSKITENGKKTKACADVRRVAIVLNMPTQGGQSSQLLDQTDNPLLLLRIPPASLNPLKDYAEKVLAPKGLPPFGIVTRMGFDITQAHPQFTFKAARYLNEQEAEKVLALRDSEDARRIIAESIEFDAGETPAGNDSQEPSHAAAVNADTTSAPMPTGTTSPAPGKKQAMRPATEEEAGAAVVTPLPVKPAKAAKPAPAPLAPAIDAEEENGIGAPIGAPVAAAVKPSKPKLVKPAPAPVIAVLATEEEEEPTAAAGVPENIESMLDSILNGS